MDQVPFFANTADDTHCVQACFKIMLKNFLPERDFSWPKLDKLSHKMPDKGTWWFASLPGLQKLGLRVKLIENFDYQRFYKEGKSYLYSKYSPEVADYHARNTNLTDLRDQIPDFLSRKLNELRPATFDDLDKFIDDGWLVAINVNSRIINKLPGFSGHVVVVFKNLKDNYVLHDPGLPPQPGHKVTKLRLKQAWAYAGPGNMALVAIKR